mmetsp:Transcript_39265/g.63668  ORF Transcript_39265/g.63668 Transcript_39265/m.63668 type:complete len:402 (+) Transcript_39265:119-1324(+)
MQSTLKPRDVCIVGAVRTPMGSFGGSLASLSATQLGSISIRAALERSRVDPRNIQEVVMGNVLSAGLGQAPARQAAIGAGLPDSVVCTTVNKVCSSGLKATDYGAQSILLGRADVVVTGGFESMSNCPYYLNKARFGMRLGNGELQDGLVWDGLWCPITSQHMGSCAEMCATEMNISREEQDSYARQSYERALKAMEAGWFMNEIVPVSIPGARGKSEVVTEDEEVRKGSQFEKFSKLKPAFKKEGGTVTAANSSVISDGSSALVLASGEAVHALGLKPIGRLLGFADAEQAPEKYPTTPTLAVPAALRRAGLDMSDIDYWEVNEAFAVVSIANNRLLKLDPARVNALGGAVSLGHPIGSSGSRIIVTLLNTLRLHGARYGAATICNGGGGASAVVVESLA